jgi:hypothetical protein
MFSACSFNDNPYVKVKVLDLKCGLACTDAWLKTYAVNEWQLLKCCTTVAIRTLVYSKCSVGGLPYKN